MAPGFFAGNEWKDRCAYGILTVLHTVGSSCEICWSRAKLSEFALLRSKRTSGRGKPEVEGGEGKGEASWMLGECG